MMRRKARHLSTAEVAKAIDPLLSSSGVAGVIHFLWLVKVVSTEHIVYALILAVLLGLRLWWAIAKRLATPAVAGRPARQPSA